MKQKIFGAFAFVALIFGSLFVSAPAANASSLGAAGSLVAYEHQNYVNQIWSAQLNSGTCNASGYTWGLSLAPWGAGHQISSFRLVLAPGQTSRCNQVGVQAINGTWYYECISRYDTGISWFGAGFNDSSATLRIRNNPNCPSF